MSLHAILTAIQENGQARAEEIAEQAKIQVRELEADIQVQAAKML